MRLRALVMSLFVFIGVGCLISPKPAYASRSTAQEYFDARARFEQNRKALQRAIKRLLQSMGMRWRGRPSFSFDGSREVTAFFKLRDGRGCEVLGELDQRGVPETSQPICSIR